MSAPGCVEFDEHVFGLIVDDLFESVCDDDFDWAAILLGWFLRFVFRSDFALKDSAHLYNSALQKASYF